MIRTLFIRHLAQSTSACLVAMTQGDLSTITWSHWQIALTTGVGVGLLSVCLSFGRPAQLQATRWGIALVALVGTFISDLVNHPSHFGAQWTEALATGVAAGLLSLVISLTPVDKLVAKLDKK